MKHPDTAALARDAYAASQARTYVDFLAMLHGTIPMRTFKRWLAGENPMDGLTQLVLREFIGGWRPGPQ